ncbi:ALDH-like protein [Nadsonia fulvescens var. elongata DSM 6958]|uniref:ALDH-like protein n=1 Tax=Nadsonia fulvescens var. elongata DSM 6958 TaxID=857566 RepID=A0A1E3PLU0_9ASCO|nr:ALDH-like protein [Nadsonia fulvescens var. elongata DSM 6958]
MALLSCSGFCRSVDWVSSQNVVFFGITLGFLPVIVLSTVVIVSTILIWNRQLPLPTLIISLPTPEPALPHWKGRRIDPISLRDSTDESKIQCYCPATGQFLASVPVSNQKDIDNSIEKSKNSQAQWQLTTWEQRRQVLRTMAKFINEHQEEVARVACRDSGKTMIDASMGEIFVTLEKLMWTIKHGEKALSPSVRPGPTNFFINHKGGKVVYSPLGVVAAFVSWNYPMHNLLGPVISSIFAGNGIIVKCSESVIWSSQYFAEIVRKSLEVCGHSPDLVQVVAVWPENADYLTTHPGLSHITFIGSKPVAHKVCAAAAQSLTPVVVELGGKDPALVIDSKSSRKHASISELNGLAEVLLRGSFQSSGQNCIGIERIIAMPYAYEHLVKVFEARVPQIRLGSGIDQQATVDMGACITDVRFSALEEIIADAVAKGARLLHGGSRYLHPKYPQGHYFQPTLLVDVTPDMLIAQNEVFGPVMTVMKATSIENAIELANSTDYGLGASVFGPDEQVLYQVSDKLQAGNVSINDFAMYYVCQLPFGGVKGSGYGKFCGVEGLRGLCIEKSICYNKYSFIKPSIPKQIRYPIEDGKKGWEFVKALNVGGYDSSIWRKIKAIKTLASS